MQAIKEEKRVFNHSNKKQYKKIALALSICLLIVWVFLGTEASLAWFADTSDTVKNVFHFGELDIVVSHRVNDTDYEEIEMDTKVFDENALYEPGYTQVIYLKVENKGDVPFDYKTAVTVTNYLPAINVYNKSFKLQDHLRFGFITADTEAELEAKIANREAAKSLATMPLNDYSTDVESLNAKDEQFMAIVIYMPESVGNIANYKGDTAPLVELGVIVSATQQGTNG